MDALKQRVLHSAQGARPLRLLALQFVASLVELANTLGVVRALRLDAPDIGDQLLAYLHKLAVVVAL
jgi:hypothetical protein